MKFLIAIVALLMLSFPAEAQIQDIDFNDYARPNFVRRALNGQPQFSGHTIYRPQLLGDNFNGRVSLGGGLNWREEKNSERWQLTQNLLLGFTLRYGDDPGLNIDFQTQYFTRINYFYRSRAYFIFDSNSDIEYNYDSTIDPRSGIIVSAVPNFGIGFGRVERVEDAIHVNRIIEILDEHGYLLKELDQDKLFAFADTISVLKNQRFYDSRLQLIKETELLIQYLDSNGYIRDLDYRGFALLKDAYDFEDIYTSRFLNGSSKEFTLGRDLRYSTNGGWLSGDDLRINFSSNSYRIIDHKSGFSRNVGLDATYKAEVLDDDFTIRKYSLSPFAGFSYFIIPTARVLFDIRSTLRYSFRQENGLQLTEKSDRFSWNNGGFLQYYFSPQISLRANVDLDLFIERNGGDLIDDYNLSWSASMVYQIY